MPPIHFASLRVRLILLILVSFLPAMGMALYVGLVQRQQAAESVRAEALRLARLAASNQEHQIEGARQLLLALAQLPQVRAAISRAPADLDGCNQLLSEILARSPAYTSINLAGLDGHVICSSSAVPPDANFSHRTWFQAVIQTRGFASSEYLIGAISGKAIIGFAYPVLDESGQFQAVIFTGLDLDWLGQLAADVQLPPGSTITVVDRGGTILARYPDPQGWIGQVVPDTPIVQAVREGGEEGTLMGPGVDGIPRLYAYTSLLPDSGIDPQYVYIGIPAEVAFANARRNLALGLGVLAGVMVAALTGAWVFADRVIIRKVRDLAGAAERLSAGDLGARTTMAIDPGEIGQLARAFDHMAESLERRQALQQQAEEALKDYALQLERSNRELQDFAYIASHDLQEPLRKIQAFGDRLLARYAGALGEEGSDYLERMYSAARRMQAMINDLLAYSRVGTHVQPFSPVDLAGIARGVAADLEVLVEKSSGQIEIGDLPHVEADPSQMRHLFQNLIANALKYRQPERPPLVKVGGRRVSPREVEISVADNGIGFDEKYLDRIFQPFQRLHGRNEYEGSGMGLAICRKIVERHGGCLTAQSRPGQGSTFIVTLPVKQP